MTSTGATMTTKQVRIAPAALTALDDDDEEKKEMPEPPMPAPSSSHKRQQSLNAPELRGHLTRQQKDRDPLFYYEVAAVLGVGSMGSVAKVRKRQSVVGGSARKDLQEYFRKERRMRECFKLPLIGGWFRFCMKGEFKPTESERSGYAGSTTTDNSSLLQPRANAYEDYNDLHGERDAEEDMLYAMKSIHLSRVTDQTFIDELKNEIKILKTLDHPHIVRAIETFEHRNQIFIIMELCSGGDLYSRDPYTEEQAARIVTSILSAISYMHSKKICHRDLKYENILFVNNDPMSVIKLIDFGLSLTFGKEELTDGVGTIYTMAPEVLKGHYTEEADLWSVGVIAFMLLSSQMPFYGRKRRQIVEQILSGHFEFKGRRWKKISNQAKAFVKDLLVLNPDDRATAEEALSASWLNRRFAATTRSPVSEELEKAHKSMIKYSSYSKLKKVALMVVAHKSTNQQIGILRKVFQRYDKKSCGQLNYQDFKAAMTEAGVTSEEEIRGIFDGVDMDGTGVIRYTEFLAATIEAQGAISEERLAEAFDRLDSDDSGFISKENLIELLGDEFPQAEIEAIIEEADIGHDGKVSYAEFLALWENQNETKRKVAMKELVETMPDSSCDSSVDDDDDDDEDDNDATGIAQRASFLAGKTSSERRVKIAADSGRKVLFSDHVVTIPDSKDAEQAQDSGANEQTNVGDNEQKNVDDNEQKNVGDSSSDEIKNGENDNMNNSMQVVDAADV